MLHNIPVQRFSVCSRKQQGSPAEWSVFHFMFRILEATKGLCLPLPPGTLHTHTFRCHNPVYLFLTQNNNKCVFALRDNRPALFRTNVSKNMLNISIVQTWRKQTVNIFSIIWIHFSIFETINPPVTQSHDFYSLMCKSLWVRILNCLGTRKEVRNAPRQGSTPLTLRLQG